MHGVRVVLFSFLARSRGHNISTVDEETTSGIICIAGSRQSDSYYLYDVHVRARVKGHSRKSKAYINSNKLKYTTEKFPASWILRSRTRISRAASYTVTFLFIRQMHS